MPTIKVIPAKKQTHTKATSDVGALLKVAAYCRVSTDHEEQESSYEAQCEHYESYINQHPGWELAGIYADEGISGLAAKKRPEFLRMINDCMAGKVQMVITKSISRFARNTLDCLNYIRMLKAKGIPILFEKENILTTDARGELLITIMASIAQQESASISQNVQMGMRYRFQQGKAAGGNTRILGYRRTPDATVEIVPEEADIVRRIFREYLEGNSPVQIAKSLTEEKVTWRYGKGSWHPATIKYILQNEKYMGTMVLQKYYTADYLTKKVRKNDGALPQYIIEDNHNPIVPREVFLQTQAEMLWRKITFKDTFTSNADRVTDNTRKIAFSSKVYCGVCGRPYRRKKSASTSTICWRCSTNVDTKFKGEKCSGRPVTEEALRQAVTEALNRLPEEEERNLQTLNDAITYGQLAKIDAALEEEPENESLLLQRAECGRQLIHIRNLLDKCKWVRGEETDPTPALACTNFDDFLVRSEPAHFLGRCERVTDDEVKRYIDKVMVYGDWFEVIFKAGVSVEVPTP